MANPTTRDRRIAARSGCSSFPPTIRRCVRSGWTLVTRRRTTSTVAGSVNGKTNDGFPFAHDAGLVPTEIVFCGRCLSRIAAVCTPGTGYSRAPSSGPSDTS